MEKKKKQAGWGEIGLSSIVLAGGMMAFIGPSILTAGLATIGITSIITQFMSADNNKFDKLFINCGLTKGEKEKLILPKLLGEKETDYGYCLRFSLPAGLSSDDFLKKKKAISENLNKRIEIEYANHCILMKVYEKDLESEYEFEPKQTKGLLEFPVGYSFDRLETIDLSAGSPHMLIAGESGAGKSTVLRAILTFIAIFKLNIKLHLIDLKRGAELNIFKKCSNVISFSRTREEAEEVLYQINREVDKRYDLFFDNNCVDIKEYNKQSKKKLDYQLVVIDEFADLQSEKDSIGIIEELAAKSRACGIHLLISTQRPDAKVLNGRIKANVPVILGLKTMNDINSRIIIDKGGLESLRGAGHGILKHNGKEVEIQSMNITPSQARDLLKPYYKQEKATFKTIEKIGEVNNFDF